MRRYSWSAHGEKRRLGTPVPKKNPAAYRKLAKLAAKVWLEHGALSYVECIADDVKPGKVTSFPQSVKLKPGEVVILSWATYKSRADRNKRQDAHVLGRLQAVRRGLSEPSSLERRDEALGFGADLVAVDQGGSPDLTGGCLQLEWLNQQMSRLVSFASIASVVAYAATLPACAECHDEEANQKVEIPGSWCDAGSCEKWRSGPCHETCAAFLDTSALSITGCEPPRPSEEPSTWVVECRYAHQTCSSTPYIASGRPQARHVPQGPIHGLDAIGRFFAEAAEAEESSVHSFVELSATLACFGGPRSLIERSRRAALDEARHRRVMTSLARSRGAEPARARPAPSGWASLCALAIDNAVAGCVEELWAAALTVHGALHAEHRDVRRALGAIAHDEARHARFAFDLADYLETHLTPTDLAAVSSARENAIARLRTFVERFDDTEPLVVAGLIPRARARQFLFDELFGVDQRRSRCAA